MTSGKGKVMKSLLHDASRSAAGGSRHCEMSRPSLVPEEPEMAATPTFSASVCRTVF